MDRCTCSEAEAAGAPDEPRCTQPEPPTLITIDSEPFVGETPPEAFQSWLTPNPLFYVRNHFSPPSVDPAAWSLSIEGQVERPLRLTAGDLDSLPKHTVPVTLECAGNNRTDLEPPVPGNRFRCGAIGTAIWAGPPLRSVLERAGLRPGVVEVLFEAADSGEPEPGEGVMPFLRSLPLEAAMHPDTILAYEMNGEPLSYEHGHPVRLIVPGWYAMASVKWLRRIEALDHSFRGFFQTERYVLENGTGHSEPLSHMLVKSHINRPEHGEVLSAEEYLVTGVAWSGRGNISCVEVSDDGGQTWKAARLEGPEHRYAWRQWSLPWEPPAPGHYTLMARAQDDMGNWQPMQAKWNSLGYAINGVMAVCVNVRG